MRLRWLHWETPATQPHRDIRSLLETEIGPLIIPVPVTAEVDYLVRQRGGARAARRFREDSTDERFRVEALTVQEHPLALAVHVQYAGLNLGLADLSVIVLAFRYRTTRLVTFDERDFRQVMPLLGGLILSPARRFVGAVCARPPAPVV